MQQNYSKAYSENELIQVFIGPVTNTGITTDFKIWNKPKGISLVHIICIGGGGGGGAGVVGVNYGGGGGGTAGGSAHLVCPAFGLPDTLYIKPGYGGTGGVGGTGTTATSSSSAGGTSYVLTKPLITTSNEFSIVHKPAGGGGGVGGLSSVGSAGTLTGNNTVKRQLTIGGFCAGIAGRAGGVSSVPIPASWYLQSNQNQGAMTTGGGGGAGTWASAAFQGGGVYVSGILSSLNDWSAGIIPGGASGGGHGMHGFNYELNQGITNFNINKNFPLYFTGGSGGGSGGPNQNGGNGGHGAIGCGGGGGGSSVGGSGVRGGNGGNGGPGAVIIICA